MGVFFSPGNVLPFGEKLETENFNVEMSPWQGRANPFPCTHLPHLTTSERRKVWGSHPEFVQAHEISKASSSWTQENQEINGQYFLKSPEVSVTDLF